MPRKESGVLGDFRMLMQYSSLEGKQVQFGFVDPGDEATSGPFDQPKDKSISCRVLTQPGEYLKILLPHASTKHASLHLVLNSPYRVSALDAVSYYVDTIFHSARDNVGVQLGRVFEPFYAQAGEFIVHPRTGKVVNQLATGKGMIHSQELTAASAGRADVRYPRRRFYITEILGTRRITHDDTTILSTEKFGDIHQGFSWVEEVGYERDDAGNTRIHRTDSAIVLERDVATSVVMPLLCTVPELDFIQVTCPHAFLKGFEEYIVSKLLPRISTSQDLINLSGFGN